VLALRRLALDGPAPQGRGRPLAEWDESVRGTFPQLEQDVDVEAVAAAWDEALAAPVWQGPPTWHHGDLMPGNLLLRKGRLGAVIDWGAAGTGDPACDLMVAWNLLGPGARAVFRAEVDVDDATWERGRGWAVATAAAALPYYRETNPLLAANAAYRLGQVLA
jgi:aminoglycoside phosphotransferase (APT) family kinase protein